MADDGDRIVCRARRLDDWRAFLFHIKVISY